MMGDHSSLPSISEGSRGSGSTSVSSTSTKTSTRVSSTDRSSTRSASQSAKVRRGSIKQKSVALAETPKLHDIDYVGTGTFQVSQENILHRRSLEPVKNSDALLSARGLHHRSKDVFEKDVTNTSTLISSIMRREKVTSAKYKPSIQLLAPHFQRALAYERLNEIDKALEDYGMCIRVDSSYSPAYFNRSGLYKVKGQFENAISDLNMAIKLEPANIEYRSQRSLLYRLSGSYIEAVKETMIGRALKKQPGIAEILEAGYDVTLDGDMRYAEKLLEDPIISALQIPPEDRQLEQLEPIIDFLKNLKVFSDVSSSRSGVEIVARKIQMVTFAKDKYIFEENQPGNHFFIVLEGEVAIVKMKKKEGMDDAFETIVVWKYYRGQSFGETALESKGGLRTAGAVASQFCRLLVLHADEYTSIIHQFKAVLKEEVRVILRSSILFEEWSDEKIEHLSSLAIVRNYGANSEILRAGDPVNSLMMIKSGIVKLLKAMPKPDTQHIRIAPSRDSGMTQLLENEEETPGLWVLEKNWRHRLEAQPVPGVGTDADDSKGGNSNSNGNSNGNSGSNSNSAKGTCAGVGSAPPGMVEFTVGVLGSGQVFGELAVLDPEKVSPVAAISSTAVEVYCFDSETMALMDCHMFVRTMNILNESLTLHDPPVEKIAYYFRAKYSWEIRKARLMHRLLK